MERNEETKIVKNALIKAGYDKKHIRVKHGSGTAWGWIRIYYDMPHKAGCTCFFDGFNPMVKDQACHILWFDTYRKIIEVVQNATGRHGEYDGRINVSLEFLENIRS